jgi:Tol biopolymer transport system component
MTLEFGNLLNSRYRIISILGQGGMGSVYRAIDENLGVNVALKENLFLSDEYAKQFRIEANILASLRHPNLPRVGDHFVIQGQGQYLIMDFIEGVDLRAHMEQNGILTEEEVIKTGITICDALTYLHTRQPPVIHRDIKPGNVKITPDGEIVLVDFGLAKFLTGDHETTTTGARAMTPGFSPPEQYGTARTDARTDIYSLGATLYVALTGRIPEDALACATGNAHLTQVRRHSPSSSPSLAAAIEKALELKADDRWQSAAEFKAALEDARDHPSTIGWDEIPTKPPVKGSIGQGKIPLAASRISGNEDAAEVDTTVRRRRFPWAVVVTIGLFAAGMIAIGMARPDLVQAALGRLATPTTLAATATKTSTAVAFAPTSTIPASVPSTATPSSTPNPTATSTSTLTPTFTPTVVSTPFGGSYGQIAFVSERSGKPQVWLMNTDGSGQHMLTNMADGACQPDWSPDGKMIIFISPCRGRSRHYPGSSLYLINGNGSGLKPLPTAPEGDFDPSWSPDGQYIAFTSMRNGRLQIYRLMLADNSVINLSVVDLSDLIISNIPHSDWQPDWSPDGKTIAFVRDRFTNQIWLMDADGKNQRQFSRSVTLADNLDNGSPSWTPDGQIIFFTQVVRDTFTPWLMGMRLQDINTINKEFIIPTNWQSSFGYISSPNISPDGFWIVFEDWLLGENQRDIYAMTITGADPRRLTTDKAYDYQPVWCPVNSVR